MIKYECEMCHKIFDDGEVTPYILPRVVQHKVRDGNGIALTVSRELEDVQTDLCPNCQSILAVLLDDVHGD